MNAVEKIQQAKARAFVQKPDGRMQKRDGKRDIAGPVVKAEVVEPAMRPGAMRAISKGHEHSEKQVQGDRANGHEANLGRRVEDG